MKYRTLGKNGPLVSSLGLGCMVMTESYGETDDQSSYQVIRHAYENGVTFFDTADMYGNGANEELVGKAVKSFRKKIVVATKCGIEVLGEGMRINNTPEYIKKSCEGSLKRLGMDTIDLYYLHRYNPEVSIEESMSAMMELINEGKILHVGLSEVSGEILERAHQILGDKLVALQTEYSLANCDIAEAVLPACRDLGVGFVAYSPIGRGLLAGKIKDTKVFSKSEAMDFRTILPQFSPELYQDNLRLVDAITEIANSKNCTPVQLSLAWLLAKGKDIIPIPGTKRPAYLKENLASVNINLSEADLAAIDQIIKEHPVKGLRYPQWLLEVFNLKN